MEETKTHAYAWSVSWIEFTAPNVQGVYWLRDKEGNTIFIGKGNVRERLLGHWNRTNPAADLAIWNHSPQSFRFELTNHPARREAKLLSPFASRVRAEARFVHP
jgi:hypothetical protein